MGGLGDWVNLLVTCAGFGAVLWQIGSARRQQRKYLEPRVFLSLRRVKTATGPVMALSILNAGKTPAMNVVVDFKDSPKWNHVSKLSYPFLAINGGIRNLPPGGENVYRLGKLDARLDHWMTIHASVEVQFEDVTKKAHSNMQVLTLADSIYLMEKQ